MLRIHKNKPLDFINVFQTCMELITLAEFKIFLLTENGWYYQMDPHYSGDIHKDKIILSS